MRDDAVHMTLTVEGAEDSDPEEVQDLTGQLRQRLLDLDVDAVRPLRGQQIPAGAKAVDAAAIGALAVTLAPAVLQAVVSLVQTWSQQRRVGSVKVTIGGDTIELGQASAQERDRLVGLFLEQHATR